MTDTARIYDRDANILCDGLQPSSRCDEAVIAAKKLAAHTRRTVALEDSDGWWTVTPGGNVRKLTRRNQAFGYMLNTNL
jgi:acyl CoA:acetate/3-ketoacid CoA transferase alpha subunit